MVDHRVEIITGSRNFPSFGRTETLTHSICMGIGFSQAGITQYSNHGIPLKKLLD